jgi:mono/diheme cytochrome c family protein
VKVAGPPRLAQTGYLRSMILLLTAALAANLENGRAVYESNCTACHGLLADGQGPAALAFETKPVDFTKTAWWATRTDPDVAAAIRAGKPGTPMSAFSQLSEAQVADLVAWLRTRAPAP